MRKLKSEIFAFASRNFCGIHSLRGLKFNVVVCKIYHTLKVLKPIFKHLHSCHAFSTRTVRKK